MHSPKYTAKEIKRASRKPSVSALALICRKRTLDFDGDTMLTAWSIS